MKSAKKFSLAAMAAAVLLLSACQTTPSNSLTFVPQAPNVSFNAANQNITLSVVAKDDRGRNEISAYTTNGGIFKLFSSPDVARLFDQVIRQDLNAKGFRINDAAPAATNVFISVKEFYAQVDAGNLRHKISAKIQLEVHVQGVKGNFTKNIGASRIDEGLFSVEGKDIHKSLNAVLQEVVSSIYRDQEIAAAIRQYSN
ncbi:putative lipoprotein [Mesocricetibacter intestinalis]|uniref:Putative lipoprotein n=1 Tax=Mesocricetibacter intestinalis TaxID=1521930 RepID=A0A4R6V6R0_9PAST|nr:YajG family lipoprotein [Mesocricetibacter intestinalis]TDQ56226.1 putative lipoprotein [Mesocricetibacter intestinalis]